MSSEYVDLKQIFKHCMLCPHQCGIDRTVSAGVCRVPSVPAIYQNFIHMGEEALLVPAFIINMCGCNLSCPTCPERHRWNQKLPVPSPERYAAALKNYLKKHQPIRSIEWIGGEPSLQLDFVLETSHHLKKIWQDAPPIYINSNMYFNRDLCALILESHDIDAFVFDLKAFPHCSKALTGAADYFDVVSNNILSCIHIAPHAPHILRHLVMPNHLECCTFPIIDWIKREIPETIVNLMTTFRDFSPNAACFELPEQDAQRAVQYAKAAALPHLLINGQ